MFRQPGGELHLISQNQVSTFPTLATQSYLRARLRFRLYLQLQPISRSGSHHDITTQKGCIHIYGNIGFRIMRLRAERTSTTATEQVLEKRREVSTPRKLRKVKAAKVASATAKASEPTCTERS